MTGKLSCSLRVFLAVGLAWLVSSARAAPIALNDSFEMPDAPTGGYLSGPTGADWVFTGSSGIADVGWTDMASPPDGSQAGYISSTSTFHQDISGFDGGTYTLSFYAQSSPVIAFAQLSSSLGGSYLTFGGNQLISPPYSEFTLFTSDPITFASGTHQLSFFGANGQLAFIDSVSFNAVPEPSSLAFLLSLATTSAETLISAHYCVSNPTDAKGIGESPMRIFAFGT